MNPFAFMRLRKAADISSPPKGLSPRKVVVQQKYDGFKVLASRTNSGTKLYTRRGIDVTARVPDIVDHLDRVLKPGQAILGEMTYIQNGEQNLQDMQRILGSKPSKAVEKTQAMSGKIVYFVYDMLEDGKDLRSLPLSDRRKHLKKLHLGRGMVRIAKDYSWTNRKRAIKDSLAIGGEGIVIKSLESPYRHKPKGESEPFGGSWKFKPAGKKYFTDDVILSSYEKGKEKLIFPAHQLHKGKMFQVGRLSGIGRENEKKAKSQIDRGKKIVVEISYQERLPSGKLRHMGWVRFRPDKPIKSATMNPSELELDDSSPEGKNPRRMAKAPDHQWHVVVERASDAGARAIEDSAWETPLGAYTRQLQLFGERKGDKVLILSGSSFERYKARRKQLGMSAPQRRSAASPNPRRSKVKDALATEALRFKKFDEFADRYWNDCARGIYWFATDNSNFFLGDREFTDAARGRFTVGCNPSFALAGKNADKDYVAELNVNRLGPGNIAVRRGTNGAEIKLLKLDGVEVLRVIPAEKALRAFRYQQGLLPSSKEQLREFWEWAWEREQARLEKEREKEVRAAVRAERKLAREQKKLEKSRRKTSSKRRPRRRNPSRETQTRLVPKYINNPCG